MFVGQNVAGYACGHALRTASVPKPLSVVFGRHSDAPLRWVCVLFHMNHPDAITDAAFAEWIRLRLSCSTSSRSPLDATDESWLRRRGFLRCCAHHTVVKSSATSLRQSPIRDQDTEDRYVVCDVSVFNRQGDLLVVALAVQR